MKIVDTVLDFAGLHGCDSKCGLKIYEQCLGGKTLVQLTELRDNSGTSVTNYIEQLAIFVREQYGLIGDVIWVEHYPADRVLRRAENFDIVTFVDGIPSWRHISHREFVDIINGDVEAACL